MFHGRTRDSLFERAKERLGDADATDHRQRQILAMTEIELNLAISYSERRDMEKAISSHRGFLENCYRHDEDTACYLICLSNNFNRFEKFEYTIEVLVGSMDMMETFDEEYFKAETNLIRTYIRCGEFLKAKAAHKKRRSTDNYDCIARWQSGRIEEELCNYEHEKMSGTRGGCSVRLARTLLRHSADNEAEAFAIFQEELDRCVDPLNRKMILNNMGTECRKLNKWDQSIEALHQLCFSATRPGGTMLSHAKQQFQIAQTYLEQYCADTTLTIDQRTELLCHAETYSLQVDEVSTEMCLIQAQLFYFNGDKS